MVAPVAAAGPDVVLLLGQISIFPGTWYAGERFFLLYLAGSAVTFTVMLRVLSALQPYVRTLIALFIPQPIKGEMTQLEEK